METEKAFKKIIHILNYKNKIIKDYHSAQTFYLQNQTLEKELEELTSRYSSQFTEEQSLILLKKYSQSKENIFIDHF